MTTEDDRGREMAWFGTAVSLGVVIGPALGGMLSRWDFHLNLRFGHFMFDNFSIPFFAAGFLGLLAFGAAIRWLPESLPTRVRQTAKSVMKSDWRTLLKNLRPLLALALAGQTALALFEGTFALYGQAMFNYGPIEVGGVFAVCGLVMTVFQAGAVGFLAGKIGEIYQIAVGFALMGTGISLLPMARTESSVVAFVAVLGLQNAANSLGQASGPLLGGALFVWQMNAPYILSGILLIAVALAIAWRTIDNRPVPSPRGEGRPLGQE